MKPTKFYLYARKSTEDEERQVMSIEAQLAELNEFARREGIKITETFIESKSAKKPGRDIFNQMIEKIYASKEPVGIIAWHPDRLARNSVDGGQIIYLIDINKILTLKFPTHWFEPTPQGLFMLQVAFGQSKYYSDNLSENVKRGIRQKIRRGEYPYLAPFGYVNDKNTRNIVIEPTEAKILKEAFQEFADGKHSLTTMSQRLHLLGLVSSNGTELGKHTVQRILTNNTYIGLIEHKGELYEGNFEPIIDKATFDDVQKELKKRSKQRKQKNGGHNFALAGLIKCGECGGMIVGQYAKKGRYIYYRCSKRMGVKCHQPYTPDVLLIDQLKEKLSEVALAKDWADFMLTEIELMQKADIVEQRSFCQNLENDIEEIQKKQDKLVNGFLDGIIDPNDYVKKKEELLKSKVQLKDQLNDFGKKGVVWFELSKSFVKAAHQAEKLASSNDLLEIKSFYKKNGLNRILFHKKLGVHFVEPFHLVPKYRALAALQVGNKKRGSTSFQLAVPSCRGGGI
jgi:site-specific DNA recombinase